MGYMETLLNRATEKIKARLKVKDKYRKRVRNRNKLYQKKLKLNRRL